MTLDWNRDFLDVLRELNADNINMLLQERDKFFKSLYWGIECNETLLEKNFKFKREQYILPNSYFNDKMKQIFYSLKEHQRNDIVDLGSYLYWGRSKDVLYACGIEAIRDFIEKYHPEYFQSFKEKILEFLIYAYCDGYCERERSSFGIGRYYLPEEYDARLNKIIAIYAETIGFLKFTNEIPIVVEKEFLQKISKGVRWSFDELLNEIKNMLGRTIVNDKAK